MPTPPSPFSWLNASPSRREEMLRVARRHGADTYGARPWVPNPYTQPDQRRAFDEGRDAARVAAKAMEGIR